MGVIIGSKAQNAVWAESVDWLAKRAGAAPAKAKRRKAGSARPARRPAKAKAKAKATVKVKAKAKKAPRRSGA